MIHAQFNDPRVSRWQARLSRIPRWAWIAFFIGVMIPIILLVIGIIVVAVTTGAIVMAAVLVVGTILGIAFRLLNRTPRNKLQANGGRENVKIVVHSARVIDP